MSLGHPHISCKDCSLSCSGNNDRLYSECNSANGLPLFKRSPHFPPPRFCVSPHDVSYWSLDYKTITEPVVYSSGVDKYQPDSLGPQPPIRGCGAPPDYLQRPATQQHEHSACFHSHAVNLAGGNNHGPRSPNGLELHVPSK